MTREELEKDGTLEIVVYTACVLERAAEYCEGGWCQSSNACDEQGKPCGATNIDATCWCASGAITCAMHRIVGTAAWTALWNGVDWHSGQALLRAILEEWPDSSQYESIPTWNDKPERTQAEVVATLGVAAQELRGWLAA